MKQDFPFNLERLQRSDISAIYRPEIVTTGLFKVEKKNINKKTWKIKSHV